MREMCLNQFHRPSSVSKKGGTGDCKECKTDKQNKECDKYIPITVQVMGIRDGD